MNVRPIDLLILGAIIYLTVKVEWQHKGERLDVSVVLGLLLSTALECAGAFWWASSAL